MPLQGAVPMGEEAWEAARIVCGRPAPGSELTQDFNPLEAGLYHAVSVDKGCYIGQETLSKVRRLGVFKGPPGIAYALRGTEHYCSAGCAAESDAQVFGRERSVRRTG